jgi:aspartate/methionine/tyrosine aminotransferase
MNIKTFYVERWMNTYELGAIYNLAETDVKPFTLDELLSLSGNKNELVEEFLQVKLSYNPTTGSQELKQIVSELYTDTYPENILITTGAIEAIFLVMNALVEAGDTVIVQFPAYQALYSTAEARGAQVKYWRMNIEKEYEPDLDELKSLIDKKTKLLVLNIPHNPTGAVISQQQLKTVISWAEEYGFWILCDEVYHDLALKPGIIPPYGRSLSKKAISVGSMSKAYGLPGLRLGWIAGPKDLTNKCWCLKDYTSISNSPINDFLAAFALKNVDKVMKRNLNIARENLEILLKWFEKHENKFDYVVPKAGVLTFPRLKNLPLTTEELCKKLYEEHRLLMVPGECFEIPGYLRIGFGNDTEMFKKGLEIFSQILI